MQEEKNEIVGKLSKFLKLPKAQRWICCEWFYSDIDQAIFESENDFATCVNQAFPRLKTRQLTRKQWSLVRSLIGKPRRCSNAFFQEERAMLDYKRQRIRFIQQRKIDSKGLIKEIGDVKDLPQEIPLIMSIGNRVYAHINQPEVGVFLGTIAAVDPHFHTYRIIFDRTSLGSQTIQDHELKSIISIKTIPLISCIPTPRSFTSTNFLTTPSHSQIAQPGPLNLLLDDLNSSTAVNNPAFAALLLHTHDLDPMLGIHSPAKVTTTTTTNATNATNATTPLLGGLPIKLILMVTRLNKILNIKRESVSKLASMNSQVEQMKAEGKCLTRQFQTDYAVLVLELERLNKDLSEYLNGVQRYCEEFAPEFRISTDQIMISSDNQSESISRKDQVKNCLSEQATLLVTKKLNDLHISNTIHSNHKLTKSPSLIKLITDLTGLYLQIRDLANASSNHSSKVNKGLLFLTQHSELINEKISEIRSGLDSAKNLGMFEDKVQVHVNHIQSTLCRFNKLQAFRSDLHSNFENENEHQGFDNVMYSVVAGSVSSSNFQVEDIEEDVEEEDDEDEMDEEEDPGTEDDEDEARSDTDSCFNIVKARDFSVEKSVVL